MKKEDSIHNNALKEQQGWASDFKKHRQEYQQSIRSSQDSKTQSSHSEKKIEIIPTLMKRLKKGCFIAIVIIVIFLAMIFTLALF